MSGETGSNRWQLDSKTEKVTLLSPGRDILTPPSDRMGCVAPPPNK